MFNSVETSCRREAATICPAPVRAARCSPAPTHTRLACGAQRALLSGAVNIHNVRDRRQTDVRQTDIRRQTAPLLNASPRGWGIIRTRLADVTCRRKRLSARPIMRMMSTGKHSRNVSQRVGLDCQIQRHFAWLVLSDLSRRQENTSSLRRSFRSIDSKWRYYSSKMLGQNCTPKPQASCAVDPRVWIVLQTTCPDGHLRTVVMHGLIIPIRRDTAVILHVIISSSSLSSFHSFVTSYTEVAANSRAWVEENSCSSRK